MKKKSKKSTALVVRAKRLPIKPPKDVIKRDDGTLPISFQDGIRLLSIDQQDMVLEEYDKRRKNFFKWLFSHLVEGIHYGMPPGCNASYDQEGNMVDRKGNKVPPNQWLPKPSIYKAGTQLMIDLMQLQTSFETDQNTWAMMGSPKGTVVRKCTMFFRGQRLGEGTGAYDLSKAEGRGQDANMTVKMADKRAAGGALLNSVPLLGELFTQDAEDKLAERRKGGLKGRQTALLPKLETMLIDNKSKWQGDPLVNTFLKAAVLNLFGPGAKLSSIGAIDEFEAALDSGKIDLDTAAVKGE